MSLDLRRAGALAVVTVLLVGACTSAATPAPTAAPTPAPTEAPTAAPTAAPTPAPTAAPTAAPTPTATVSPEAAVVAEACAEAKTASDWPTEWTGPTTPTKLKPGAKIVAISCSQATACATEVEGMVEGAKAAGWDLQVVDGKGDPSVYSSAIRNAVTSGAGGIILASISPGLVVDALRFAKENNVPVVNNLSITQEQAGLNPADKLVAGDNYSDLQQRGRAKANYIICNSNGTGKVFLYRTDDAGLKARDDATVARLKECTGCTILGEDWAGFATTTTPKMTASVTSILDRFGNDLQYIVTPYSAADYFTVQALEARGRSDVKILNDSPFPDQIKLCNEGKYIGAAALTDLNWTGWGAIDMMSRVFENPGAMPPNENHPWVNLVKDTCPASGNATEGNTVDYRAEYQKLWGVQ